ncbi:hypothetical protein CISG_08397 [Coccidioides immitis RMSCC 3703]|uniref:Uncharacterized protein n=1 Tax=Coccidioides immitis RMSCC 3703 TaxID=454286 RepID=A0A0J8R645_COCIT|nr:hypothetical protein CISG_08397 [Coccidioides immitis RMSCC 3703]
MAGVKRKLEDEHEPNGTSQEPADVSPVKTTTQQMQTTSPSSSPVTPEKNTSAKPAQQSNGRPGGLEANGDGSSPGSSQPQTPARKKRRTQEEILLAEQFARAQVPRSTRQSARILSKRRATDPSPNVGNAAEQLPKAASMEPNLPPLTSFDHSHESLPGEPAIPEIVSHGFASLRGHWLEANAGFSADIKSNGVDSYGFPRTRQPGDRETKVPEVSQSIKSPKREQSDENQVLETASHGNEEAEPPRSVPALTLSTDLPTGQSTDIETPAGNEVSRSAMSMSPLATQSEAADLSASTVPVITTRARGGGRPRGKGKGRKAATGRKAAGAGKAGPKLHLYDRNLSPSASAAVKKLRDRQKELHHAFRRVASAQRAALVVLANRSEACLVKDPKAHMETPLYQEVLDDLQERLGRKKAIINREYELKVECEKNTLEAYDHWIKSAFKEKVESVRDEHILAAQGSFLQYLDQCRQEGDEDHTENPTWSIRKSIVASPTNPSVASTALTFEIPVEQRFYERADSGWDDFVQRARIGGDIFALLKDMNEEAKRDKEEQKRRREEAKKKNKEAVAEDDENTEDEAAEGDSNRPRFSDPRFQRLMSALADACELAEGRSATKDERKEGEEEEEEAEMTTKPESANALNALAEIALKSSTEVSSVDTGHRAVDAQLPTSATAGHISAEHPGVPTERTSQLPPQPYMGPQYSEQLPPRAMHRAILPQPMPTQALPAPPEHQPYYAPQYQVPPPPQQPQQPPAGAPSRSYPALPRPLLAAARPAPQEFPPIREQLSEQLRLPDPFSSAPQHLPAPPGLRYPAGPAHAPPPAGHQTHRPSQSGPYPPPLLPQYMPGPPVGYAHAPPPPPLPPPGPYHQHSMYPTQYYSPYHPHSAPPPPRPHQALPPQPLHPSQAPQGPHGQHGLHQGLPPPPRY